MIKVSPLEFVMKLSFMLSSPSPSSPSGVDHALQVYCDQIYLNPVPGVLYAQLFWEGRSQLDLAALVGWGVVNSLVQVDRDFDLVFGLRYFNSFLQE
jgi:hypothetical protein